MTLHRILKKWAWVAFFCAVLSAYWIPLVSRWHFGRYIISLGIVVATCYGYWLSEEALMKRGHEKESIWCKSWPTYLICGITILVVMVVMLSQLLPGR
jgi:hypothetical protein